MPINISTTRLDCGFRRVLLTVLRLTLVILVLATAASSAEKAGPAQHRAMPDVSRSTVSGQKPDNSPSNCLQPGDGFNIIHSFNPSEMPDGGRGGSLVVDRFANVYGTTTGGARGLAYRLSRHGQDWDFTRLREFTGGDDGYYPGVILTGKDGTPYGIAGGGVHGCGPDGNYDCDFIFRLRPTLSACLPGTCDWIEEVLYRFPDNEHGWNPVTLVFDQGGNVYGSAYEGGAYGNGAIFKLTPSDGGWTEKVLYSFTGGNDGGNPGSLLWAPDGTLYGTTWAGGVYGFGVVYQLSPSDGSWNQQVIRAFAGQDDGEYPASLRRDPAGNLYGRSFVHYSSGNLAQKLFMLSPSGNDWSFSVIWQPQYQYEIVGGLAMSATGNLYGVATNSIFIGGDQSMIDFFKKTPDGQFQHWLRTGVFFPADFGLVADPNGNLYGMTDQCGADNLGTIWQFTGFSN